jgi:START domain
MKQIYLICWLAVSFAGLSADAQDGWVFRKEKDNIKVYTKENPQSKFNDIKVELTIKAKLSELASLILDIDHYSNWSKSLKKAYILKKISNDELYFYSEVNSPWPASNRDLIVHLKISQDPSTKIMTIRAMGVPNFIPAKKDLVRIPFSNETWTVVPVDKQTVKITYHIQIDPGGGAPGWLVNMFSTKAPLESFRYLSILVKQPAYQQSEIAFIRN